MDQKSLPDANPPVNPWVIAGTVMSCTFLEVLDTTIVNVSLPHIAGNLSASVEEATWVLSSYLVSNAIVQPITGWLARRFGRKRVLMMAVSGFTLASLLCGLAPSLPFLIICRVVQGAAGGNLQPLTQAVLWETFPVEKRGKAMGFLGLAFVTAPLMGPMLGGWITEHYTWRWIFYINLPVGIASLFLLQAYLFDPPYLRRASGRVDFVGIGLLVVGIAALQIMLDKGQLEDWFASGLIQTLAITTVVALVVFIFYELRIAAPVVDLQVFRIKTFSVGVVFVVVIGFVVYGSMVLLPIMLQVFMGYPALEAGFATAPRGIGSLVAMPLAGTLTTKLDHRKLLTLGLIFATVVMFAFARLNLNAGYWDIFWPQLLQGFSLGFVWVPLMVIAMAPISKEITGNATGVFTLMRNLGSSVGIASVATWLARGQQRHLNVLGAHVSPYEPPASQTLWTLRNQWMIGGLDPVTATQQSYGTVWHMIQREAAMLACIDIFWLLGFMFLALVPLVFLMKRPIPKERKLPAD